MGRSHLQYSFQSSQTSLPFTSTQTSLCYNLTLATALSTALLFVLWSYMHFFLGVMFTLSHFLPLVLHSFKSSKIASVASLEFLLAAIQQTFVKESDSIWLKRVETPSSATCTRAFHFRLYSRYIYCCNRYSIAITSSLAKLLCWWFLATCNAETIE